MTLSNDATVGYVFARTGGVYDDGLGRLHSYNMETGELIAQSPTPASPFTHRVRDVAVRPGSDTLFKLMEGSTDLTLYEHDQQLTQLDTIDITDDVPYQHLATFCSLAFDHSGEPIVSGVMMLGGAYMSYAASPAWSTGTGTEWGWLGLAFFPAVNDSELEARQHCPTWEVDHKGDRHVVLIKATNDDPYLRVGTEAQMFANTSTVFPLLPDAGEVPTDIAAYSPVILVSYGDGTGGPGRLELLGDSLSTPEPDYTFVDQIQLDVSDAVAIPHTDSAYTAEDGGLRAYVAGEGVAGLHPLLRVNGSI